MVAVGELASVESGLAWEFQPAGPGGIVVGVDGSPASIEALNTAAVMARVSGVPMHAVTVLAPFVSERMDPESPGSSESVNELRRALRESELREIVRALEPPPSWTHTAIIGWPAREITTFAGRYGADMIIIGRHRHGKMDQLLGGETTLRIMRGSRVPVLAVDAPLDVPKAVVAAIDFSDASIHAARVAMSTMAGSGTIYLVHAESETRTDRWDLHDDIVTKFRRVTEELCCPRGVVAETVLLAGRPASAVSQFADRVGADLIAAGSHGRGAMERFLLGSVSTALVRDSHCAVLVVPPASL